MSILDQIDCHNRVLAVVPLDLEGNQDVTEPVSFLVKEVILLLHRQLGRQIELFALLLGVVLVLVEVQH